MGSDQINGSEALGLASVRDSSFGVADSFGEAGFAFESISLGALCVCNGSGCSELSCAEPGLLVVTGAFLIAGKSLPQEVQNLAPCLLGVPHAGQYRGFVIRVVPV